jgi:hypothetical protein
LTSGTREGKLVCGGNKKELENLEVIALLGEEDGNLNKLQIQKKMSF